MDWIYDQVVTSIGSKGLNTETRSGLQLSKIVRLITVMNLVIKSITSRVDITRVHSIHAFESRLKLVRQTPPGKRKPRMGRCAAASAAITPPLS